MTDPFRSDRPASPADLQERDREARVEHLLLAGLDHYFAGQYERAISVWTRVLFLNHGHARARAYMERARSAIAERQRESEEVLHSGVEAFSRGDGAAARRLLTSAVERGTGTDEALALLDRLSRLERTVPSSEGQPVPLASQREPLDAPAVVNPSRPPRARWLAAGVGAGLVAAAIWIWLGGADRWPAHASTPVRPSVAMESEPLQVPAASEASLSRARALQAKGRLHDALTALEAVRQGDSSWDEVQALRSAIQRQLRAGAGAPLTTPPALGTGQGTPQ